MTEQLPIVRVVDDDPSFLRAVSRRLQVEGFDVETFESVDAFLSSRNREAPGCLVLDVRMPQTSGLELQDEVARSAEPLPIVFLTAYGDVPTSVRAMKKGAVDFLTKPVDGETLVQAVRQALIRDRQAREARRQLRDVRRRYESLTARQREVFALVVRGLLNKQVADELGTTERTIKAHRAAVMAKMRAQSAADLVRAAERLAER
ncbi:MAG TPA: response regulator [Vicinamibacterales bacterium]|nr:response regulator [Vicinamibacterales bacterium]